MPDPSRRPLSALAAALVPPGLRGWTAADRAARSAPRPRPRPAAPAAATTGPGAVHAWAAHPPAPVPGWDDVVSVAGTGSTTAAVHADGTVSAYGSGQRGALGDGDPHHAPVPRPVPGVTGARSVHAVGGALFAVRTDGTVLGWGEGFLARGGVRAGGRAEPRPIPVRGLRDVVAISPGSLSALALRGDGTVVGWGVSLTGALGDRHRTGAAPVRGVRGVTSVAAAGGAVVAALSSGEVCAWGTNAHGLLGVEPTGGQSGRPVRLAVPAGVVQVAGGRDVAFALDGAGAVRAWGRGAQGALGDGDPADHVRAAPRVVDGLPPARLVAAHGLTGYAVDTGGGLWAWGCGLPLPGPPAGPVLRPVRIPLPGPVLAVSGAHALLG